MTRAYFQQNGTLARDTDTSHEARIGEKITPQPNGCWLYREDDPGRYNVIRPQGRTVSVHCWVYETLVGPIPDGHELHHRCETPACCNPAHLVPLTSKEHKAAHKRGAHA